MGSGRIYWGQILVVLSALVLSAIAATQWVAAALGYQPQLGSPDIVLFGAAFYAPWKFLEWWYRFDAYARDIFETGAFIFLGGIGIAVLSAFGFSLWRSREDGNAKTYGTAHWASPLDIKRLGLTSGDGVVLGQANGRILRHDGDEHVLVVAPTNTGKSVGISLPTGLVWRGSFLALDLKGESWTVTSGLRRTFGPVYRFAPTTSDTHRYNPLTQVRRGEAEVRDAQVLADMLVDPEGALRERSHWQLRAFELLVAAMLWTLYAERDKSLARVGEILADPERPVLHLFTDMLNRPIRDGAPHPVVAAGARQMLDMAEGERSGVVSTALGCLALYRDPVLARATAASDFAIEDLVAGPKPVSLYLIVPPEEMSRLKALLRLVINQMLKRLTEVAAREPHGRRVLLLLDEFPQLGKLDFFEHALAYIRGYRLKACLIAQSLNQIVQAYGEHASIIDNAHVRVAFACNDERTARRISDMLGVTTETRAQMNYAGSRMAPWLGHTMVSRQEVGRPLLTPGEVMQLPPEEAVILTGGAPPIRANKIRYYAMPTFMARVRPPFASPRLDAQGLATSWDGLLAPSSPRPQGSAAGGSISRRVQVAQQVRDAVTPQQGSFDFIGREPGTTEDDAPAVAFAGTGSNLTAMGSAPQPDPDDLDGVL